MLCRLNAEITACRKYHRITLEVGGAGAPLSIFYSLSFPFLIDDTNTRRNTCYTGKMQEIGNLDGCLRRQTNLVKDAHKRLKIISDEVGIVFVFVDPGKQL